MRTGRLTGTPLFAACIAALGVAVAAQGRGGQNWTTAGADAQRSAWIKNDPKISRETMQKPGFRFLWKAKLDNQSRHSNSLTPALLLGNIISYKGFKALAYVGGSSDVVYSIDYDLNRMFWTRRLTPAPGSGTSAQCPGGLTAITRVTPLRQPGRGSPPAVSSPPPARAAGPGGPIVNGNIPLAVYAIDSSGLAHMLNPQTGEDMVAPVKLFGPNAKVVGAVYVDNVLYAATADNCGNVPNGVWAVDFSTAARTVTRWETKGASIVGNAAPAAGNDGLIFAATSDGEIVALEPRTLALKDSFSAGKAPFVTGPVVFFRDGKDFVAAANKDGRVYLLDAASLGGANHQTPLARSEPIAGGAGASALATWEDNDGTRWILAPSAGRIISFKVIDQNGAVALQQGWSSRDIASPGAPIVINGVVFAFASGDSRTPAVLYALDGATGKELWTSGNTITSFVDSGGLSGLDSQVYVGTHDNTLYAFGVPMEH